MTNIQYEIKLSNKRNYKIGLPSVECPRCKKILFEGIVEEYYSRCKNCGCWVHIKIKK